MYTCQKQSINWIRWVQNFINSPSAQTFLTEVFLGVRCSAAPPVLLDRPGVTPSWRQTQSGTVFKIGICSLGEDPGKKSGNPGSEVGCTNNFPLAWKKDKENDEFQGGQIFGNLI